MDMSGFKDFLPGSEDRAETKKLAIAAFHDHCFIHADSASQDDIAESIQAYFDYPDEHAKGILRQAAFTVQDVLDHANTIEVGSPSYERLILAQNESMAEDYLEFKPDENTL